MANQLILLVEGEGLEPSTRHYEDWGRSTDKQTVENQRLELTALLEQRGWNIVATREDKASGTKGREQRAGCDALHRDPTAGRFDVALAWAMDRIGRSLPHVSSFMAELQPLNVGLYLHRQVVDTTTPAGKMFAHVLATVAEFERDMIVDRVRSGMERAKRRGTKSGKPIGKTPLPEATANSIRLLKSRGGPARSIARELKVSTSTVHYVLHPKPAKDK